MKSSSRKYDTGVLTHIVAYSVVCEVSCKSWRECLSGIAASCPEAEQRTKQNRNSHSAEASLRSLLLEESCITKQAKPKYKKLKHKN